MNKRLMNMAFMDLAKSRYSVRKFSDKPIEKEKLDAILEAGRIAPTGHNYQPYRVYVLQSAEALEEDPGADSLRVQRAGRADGDGAQG